MEINKLKQYVLKYLNSILIKKYNKTINDIHEISIPMLATKYQHINYADGIFEEHEILLDYVPIITQQGDQKAGKLFSYGVGICPKCGVLYVGLMMTQTIDAPNSQNGVGYNGVIFKPYMLIVN